MRNFMSDWWKRWKHPLYNYFGGKFNQLEQVMPCFPADIFKRDVLFPFAGAMNEVLALPRPCHSITAIELSDFVSNFLIQAYENTEALVMEINRLPPPCSGVYERFKQQMMNESLWDLIPRIRQAAVWFYVQSNKFQGSYHGPKGRNPSSFCGTNHVVHTRKKINTQGTTKTSEIREMVAHLRHLDVNIRKGDGMGYLEEYMGVKKGFCYCDPPYPLQKGKYPGVPCAHIEFFERFFEILKKATNGCRFLVTIDVKPEIEEMINDSWFSIPLVKRYKSYRARPGEKIKLSGERLIANYPIPQTWGGTLDFL